MMDPRTHPRGAPPDFTLPAPNPNPARMTDALWWLVCMRLLLEPKSRNGGTFANKPGSHNAGENLPDYGQGDPRTDHSIRDAVNRTGPWWQRYCSAHDWTFVDAQRGDYRTIALYTQRRLAAMRDASDPRPDLVYHYTLGQADSDQAVEGYHELGEYGLSSKDLSHLWHLHDSFLRSAVGDYWAMWAALTIDMGWTVAQWRQSLGEGFMGLTDEEQRELLIGLRSIKDMTTRIHWSVGRGTGQPAEAFTWAWPRLVDQVRAIPDLVLARLGRAPVDDVARALVAAGQDPAELASALLGLRPPEDISE